MDENRNRVGADQSQTSVSNGAQPGHHSSSRSLKRRIRRALRSHRWLLPVIALCVALAVGLGLYAYNALQGKNTPQITAADHNNVGSGYRDILYKGKRYRYNNRITTILYAGVDSDGELQTYKQYTYAPRADSISLVVLDELNRKMTVIALSRDTMTPIHKYTLNGKDRGMLRDHLGYAYAYGEGGKVSCRNLCESVSNLLYGIPVNDYVVSNRSSLPTLSELIGPVEVTVPNDDLTELGWRAGQTITIDASNLESFVRSRDTAEDFSNVGRMERQQVYINGAVQKIRNLVQNDTMAAWESLQSAEFCFQTNITRNRYLDLAKSLLNTTYNEGDYYMPEGEQVAASDHDEFYPDEDKLLAKVIEIFYIEQ